MEKKRIPWENAPTYVGKQNTASITPEGLDNDETTIQNERSTLQRRLTQLDPDLSVISVERDDGGTTDSFILNTVSLRYVEEIIGFFKDNSVQYEVEKELCAVPIEKGPSASYRPMQRTVVIYRRALKKLKRSPFLTVFYTFLCFFVLSLCFRFFLRLMF